jgi:hypothetical protein
MMAEGGGEKVSRDGDQDVRRLSPARCPYASDASLLIVGFISGPGIVLLTHAPLRCCGVA